MSFVERIAAAGLDLADPAVMLSVCVTGIIVCVLLDAPEIMRAVRIFHRRRRLARVIGNYGRLTRSKQLGKKSSDRNSAAIQWER
jgi:hypothetical protein